MLLLLAVCHFLALPAGQRGRFSRRRPRYGRGRGRGRRYDNRGDEGETSENAEGESEKDGDRPRSEYPAISFYVVYNSRCVVHNLRYGDHC